MSLEALKARLFKFSKPNGECIESTYKARSQSGYAILQINNITTGAHRASWIVHFGEIPKGKWVLHRCDNPLCIKPDHLFLGTAKDNTNDMISKNRHNYFGNKKYSRELVEKSIELRKQGKTYKEIEKITGIPFASVHMHVRSLALKTKGQTFYNQEKYPKSIRDQAFRLRKDGIKSKEIQKILNIPKRSLQRILKNYIMQSS